MIYGKEIQEVEELEGDLLCPAVAQDLYQKDQAAFGLSKYQMLWITFGKGLLIGYFLAFLFHR